MLKNITQYIRHNLKTGKAIMILLAVVMLICGSIPAFMQFSDRLESYEYRNGVEKIEYAKYIAEDLNHLFDISEEFYSVLLSLISAVAGLVLSYILFYYFRKKNSADFFLSLPLTRTDAYISNFISGILYYIIPLIATSLVTLIGLNIMGSWRFTNISNLLLMTEDSCGIFAMLGNNLAFFLLFFAIGTVSVLLSSNGINALAVYGTINFYPIVFIFLLLSSAEIFNNDIIDFAEEILYDFLPITPIVRVLVFAELPATVWTYIGAVIGAAIFAALGCLLCNMRPAESWSSAIIYKPVRLCLQYIYCFIVAFAGGLFFYVISNRSLINIIVGSIVGLIVAFMVLNIIFERDVKAIFRKPLRLVWSALIFIAVFIVIVIDIFGIFRYRQPSPDSIDYVLVSLNHNITTANYYSNDDNAGLSRLESKEDKQTAIELYSILHEQIRDDNYSYLFRNDRIGSVVSGMEQFDNLVFNWLGLSNRIELKMMKNSKELRPLRSNHFEKTFDMYELYKAIYDSPAYIDPYIPVLEHAEFVRAELTASEINSYGNYNNHNASNTEVLVKDPEGLEMLRLALIKDFKNASFEDLQDTTHYVLNVMYNLNQDNEIEKTVVEDVEAVIHKPNPYSTYEREEDIVIPSSFVNTMEVLEKYFDMENIEKRVDEALENIAKIVVEIYSDDAPTKYIEVTDRDEIKLIMADSVNRLNRTMIFPKRGVALKIYPSNIEDYYDEYYLKNYQGSLEELSEANVNIAFLKRTSKLY